MKKEQIRKFILIFVILLFLLSLIFVIRQFFFSSSGTFALIYQDNVLVHKIDLKTAEPTEFTLHYNSGDTPGYNTICVKDGKIGIVDANCPDKVCKQMGMTSSSHFPITCMPHKLIIEIVDTDKENLDTLDVISH